MAGKEQSGKKKSRIEETQQSAKMMETLRKVKNLTEVEEPAWKTVQRKAGLDVWRVKKFALELVPKQKHGTFYDGDSYIVLNVHESRSRKLLFDVYMWIGRHSTQDEYSVAAYKMAELDNLVLGGIAVQHREVQGLETSGFQALFPCMQINKGGYDSGFRHAAGEAFSPRLLLISGEKSNVKVTQVSYRRCNISTDDVTLIDLGAVIYQVIGAGASKEEKYRGAQVCRTIAAERGKCKIEVIDDYTPTTEHPCIDAVPVKGEKTGRKGSVSASSFSLWRLSDETGQLQMTPVCREKCAKSSLCTSDAYIYDVASMVFVWIGKSASRSEKTMAMSYAQDYLERHGRPRTPVTITPEGNEPEELLALLK